MKAGGSFPSFNALNFACMAQTSRGFKKDVTEKSANITLEEAKKLREAATLARIRETPIGKNFEIEGVKLKGGNFLVKGIREV